jgi:sugar lactone lactonase YvrE
MRTFARVVAGGAALAVAYLAFWPVPIEPRAWHAPAFAGYAGAHAVNERLAELRLVSTAPHVGPEHIEVGPDGKLYTGVLAGAILRMNPDGTGEEVFADTGGRPLGLAFDAGGRLIVADGLRGLLAVERDGSISVLVEEYGGAPLLYPDAVVVAADGGLLFTDASQRISPREHGTFDAALLDIMEHSCTGRVLRYDPESGRTSLLMEGLCFPNGLALSRDGRSLFVAETGEYRIWKIDADARGLDARSPAALSGGRARLVATNLPGFPDNLTRGENGRIWVGLTKPRGSAVDALADRPFLRKVALRLPRFLWPVPPSRGHVIAFDEDGRVLVDLQDPSGRLPETSGATEYHGRLYVQSLHALAFGVLPAHVLPSQ